MDGLEFGLKTENAFQIFHQFFRILEGIFHVDPAVQSWSTSSKLLVVQDEGLEGFSSGGSFSTSAIDSTWGAEITKKTAGRENGTDQGTTTMARRISSVDVLTLKLKLQDS